MNSIIDTLASPLWWLTAIISGLAVNILAAYIKPVLDKLLSSISKTYRKWSLDRKERVGKVAYYLLENPQELADLRGQVIHLTLKMILTITAGLFLSLGLEFIIEVSTIKEEAYLWLKIIIYFITSLITIYLFQKYRILALILKDCDVSVYSAADRYKLKKYN